MRRQRPLLSDGPTERRFPQRGASSCRGGHQGATPDLGNGKLSVYGPLPRPSPKRRGESGPPARDQFGKQRYIVAPVTTPAIVQRLAIT
jgi:hypothetical protein